jgi:serine/threonine protein kinase
MKTEDRRTCLSCGNEFSGAMEFCPVCTLRKALKDGIESGESSFEEVVKPISGQATQRFEHYELVLGNDGKPVELGRGAMGVTYKAFDIDLQCPVALKVISERYLGDESARLRFLREARSAARLRHSNVASVLHLGRTGSSYFYAMEFVEGQTLAELIKCSGQIEVKLALDIAMQVAAGLSAVHKQKLVHRDIKPSNIMVNVEEDSTLTAKIIDLGLAKPAPDAPADDAISTPGAFAGTPEFASPEQFSGVEVDIRSDLYSLGATLWQMLTGHVLFRGFPAEVMYQHQHARLPLERLKDFPQPVIVLLKKLLEKDPAQRFQTPDELLKAIPKITDATDARRRITRQSLQNIPSAASRAATRKPRARLAPKKISVARLPVTGSDVFGREEDIAFLDDAWANQQVNVVTIVAWAGVGKSTLVNHWLRRVASDLRIIALRSSFLVGPSTDRASVGRLRPQKNFSMWLSLGSGIQNHGSVPPGKKAKDWRSSSHIVEPYWFWMAWSRSKIRQVHKRDGYGSLPSRRYCANSLPSILGCA